jgi:hypothetical protein
MVGRFITDLLIETLELFANLIDRFPWGNIQGDQYGMRCNDVAGMVQLFTEKAKIELHMIAFESPY